MSRPRKLRTGVQPLLRSSALLPEYDRGSACPPGLLTRRQLRDRGLSPGGQGPVGVLRCRACSFRPHLSCTHRTRAWLYDVELARPKRTPTLAQEEALDRAMAARSTCPECRRRYFCCLPLRTQGRCDPCAGGYEPSPGTYMPATAPVIDRMAA
ncbi:RRQRL motif-containing zinc-binding protein [Streptomyces harbinensis]|uniref:RRQRL motif-containing zinc-binding protein n=1 Tax=Streptomyces harbinensis TaxID=1176198 RepID=UPI0034E01245